MKNNEQKFSIEEILTNIYIEKDYITCKNEPDCVYLKFSLPLLDELLGHSVFEDRGFIRDTNKVVLLEYQYIEIKEILFDWLIETLDIKTNPEKSTMDYIKEIRKRIKNENVQ
jgi:hypothetical protein